MLTEFRLFCRTTWCNRRSCYTLEGTLLRVCYSLLIKTVYTKSGGAFVNSVNSNNFISGAICTSGDPKAGMTSSQDRSF